MDFARKTGQTHCAYCGISLANDYHHWLLMAIDHAVPVAEARRLAIPIEYYSDCINLLVCCSGCNGFDNRYQIQREPQSDWTLRGFIALRDEVFADRAARIARRRQQEEDFFEKELWK